MTIEQILALLGQAAPWDKSAEWDAAGFQLGDPQGRAQTVAVCHEVTEAVVARVEKMGVDLLISYHPLLFRPITRLVAGQSPPGRAYRLIRQGTSLAIMHTNFDVAPGGVADALAEALGLVAITPFGPSESAPHLKVITFAPATAADLVADAMAAAGGGTIGNYSSCSFRVDGTGTFLAGEGATPVTGTVGTPSREPEVRIEMTVPRSRRDAVVRALVAAHPYEEPAFDVYEVIGNLGLAGRVGNPDPPTDFDGLIARTVEALGGRDLRHRGDPARPIGRVAVVPGSGSSFIGTAAAAGADVLVTGDVSHHRMVEASDRGMSIIDAGHVATERPGVRRLYDLVAGIVPEAVDLTNLEVGESSQ